VTDVKLTDDIIEAVNGAYDAGAPPLVAYVDENGQPSLSIRGSCHVHNDHQLAVWIRNRDRGLFKALANNPRVSVMVRIAETRTTLIFRTIAHADESEAGRARVYEEMHPNERKADPEMKGVALILDIERLEGRTPAGAYRMVKGGA
jgi:hypothetical protein